MKTKVGDKIRICFGAWPPGFRPTQTGHEHPALLSLEKYRVAAIYPDGRVGVRFIKGQTPKPIKSWVRASK